MTHSNLPETTDFYCDFVLNNAIKVERMRETEHILAFHHTKPSWSFHVVIVPKQHITQLTEVSDPSLFQEIFTIAQEIITEYHLDDTNFKIITNGGEFQDSKHLHFHLVSGSMLPTL